MSKKVKARYALQILLLIDLNKSDVSLYALYQWLEPAFSIQRPEIEWCPSYL